MCEFCVNKDSRSVTTETTGILPGEARRQAVATALHPLLGGIANLVSIVTDYDQPKKPLYKIPTDLFLHMLTLPYSQSSRDSDYRTQVTQLAERYKDARLFVDLSRTEFYRHSTRQIPWLEARITDLMKTHFPHIERLATPAYGGSLDPIQSRYRNSVSWFRHDHTLVAISDLKGVDITSTPRTSGITYASTKENPSYSVTITPASNEVLIQEWTGPDKSTILFQTNGQRDLRTKHAEIVDEEPQTNGPRDPRTGCAELIAEEPQPAQQNQLGAGPSAHMARLTTQMAALTVTTNTANS